MPLRESAALGVLARQPDVVALLQQRAERQRLAGRPVDANAAVDRFGAVFEKALNGAVNPEAVGHPGDLAADLLQHRDFDAGHAAARILFASADLKPAHLPSSQSALLGL